MAFGGQRPELRDPKLSKLYADQKRERIMRRQTLSDDVYFLVTAGLRLPLRLGRWVVRRAGG